MTMNINKHLCNAATCLIQPKQLGPIGDRIRQVPLYFIKYHIIFRKVSSEAENMRNQGCGH